MAGLIRLAGLRQALPVAPPQEESDAPQVLSGKGPVGVGSRAAVAPQALSQKGPVQVQFIRHWEFTKYGILFCCPVGLTTVIVRHPTSEEIIKVYVSPGKSVIVARTEVEDYFIIK